MKKSVRHEDVISQERALFAHFQAHALEVVSAQALATDVFGYQGLDRAHRNALYQAVSRLRKSLQAGFLGRLENIRGKGWRYRPVDARASLTLPRTRQRRARGRLVIRARCEACGNVLVRLARDADRMEDTDWMHCGRDMTMLRPAFAIRTHTGIRYDTKTPFLRDRDAAWREEIFATWYARQREALTAYLVNEGLMLEDILDRKEEPRTDVNTPMEEGVPF